MQMNFPYFPTKRAISRRHFLRGAGVAVALPWMDAMRPAFASEAPAAPPRRFLAICNNLGLLTDKLFPADFGPDYRLSPYLELLKDHRSQFTVFSGVSHPDVDGAHAAELCFLTGAPHPANSGFRNTISLDQYVAERVGHMTRFPSLQLAVNAPATRRCLSWTGSGAMIPSEGKASTVFQRMFLQGSQAEVDARVRQLALGRSVLDAVADQTHGLQAGLGAMDRDRIDQYLTGVRDLEKRLAAAGEWERRPRPSVTAPVPKDPESPTQYMDKVQVMYDLAKLAFETDSTRLITLMLDGASSPVIEVEGADITIGYHDLSHHGQSTQKLAQLEQIDREHMRKLNGLLDGLTASKENGGALLDRTMVLYGSNFGNASSHVNTNLPVIIAGGGFRHGRHLAFSREHNYPLANLYVSVLQRLGIEADRFANSTGTMRGLEMA